MKPCIVVDLQGEPVRTSRELVLELRARAARRARLVTYFGRASDDGGTVLTAVFQEPAGLHVVRGQLLRDKPLPSVTTDIPCFHIFERELHEQLGVDVRGHPWLKPVRFAGRAAPLIDDYPFFKIDGKEVHEVGVGPIHAGIIEPGHFRFMCEGERVHHLEIQLGYQHRGLEQLLLRTDPRAATPLIETTAGDSSAAYAWAWCQALEALSGVTLPDDDDVLRGVALELERVAMHLAGLSGLATDIAFLQGSSSYGRLRTVLLNTTMRLSGSRFARAWLRPGGMRAGIDHATASAVREGLAAAKRDIGLVDELFLDARSVRHRLMETGVVTREDARAIGLVGPAARASGIDVDVRGSVSTAAPWGALPIRVLTEPAGDCWARARIRIREIEASLSWLDAALERPHPASMQPIGALQPQALALSLCEGWRGEVVVVVETDARGSVVHAKVQDPSLRNWFGLALAMRGNDISDFPICNKSFDLSYCGNDL